MVHAEIMKETGRSERERMKDGLRIIFHTLAPMLRLTTFFIFGRLPHLVLRMTERIKRASIFNTFIKSC